MGMVKTFGLYLAESIYLYNWSDEQIISTLTDKYPDAKQPCINAWLNGQINIVIEYPSLYLSMLDKNKKEGI